MVLSFAHNITPLALAGIAASSVDVYETTPDSGNGRDRVDSFSGLGEGLQSIQQMVTVMAMTIEAGTRQHLAAHPQC